ncbi:MAG: hypothetical protein E5W83_21105 [Mesorhizobium sp.]|nr:MAG: hypothetical protein E5W83_21105 [Mesorhizobium sp.]
MECAQNHLCGGDETSQSVCWVLQNGGRLSNRAREKEFAALTDGEAERIEAIYQQTFGSD